MRKHEEEEEEVVFSSFRNEGSEEITRYFCPGGDVKKRRRRGIRMAAYVAKCLFLPLAPTKLNAHMCLPHPPPQPHDSKLMMAAEGGRHLPLLAAFALEATSLNVTKVP